MNVNAFDRTLLGSLNSEQRKAVTKLSGPLLVLAGAGTGKTRVITYRIAHLLSQNVRPENILAVTFTKKAATEMQQRVAELAGPAVRGMRISTFHSLGLEILRDHFQYVGLRRGFGVCSDDNTRAKMLDKTLRSLDRADRDVYLDAGAMLRRISLAKNRDLRTKTLASRRSDERLLAEIITRYDARLRAANLVDLDDLVTLPLRILRKQNPVRKSYQRRFRYLLVDEYQDTNEVQYQLMRLLLSCERNICVVGDDDQAIYAFRGATVAKIRGFPREFPETSVIRLIRNDRSSQQILSFSNTVIAKSKRRMAKQLRSELGGGAPVQLGYARHDHEERRFIARRIGELHCGCGTPYAEIAVLVRILDQRTAVMRELTRSGIPVWPTQTGGVRVMTLHASKGLEWSVVFLPGLEEDTLPHWNAVRAGSEAIEEERRLFYVGATRAQRELIVSTSATRANHARTPSRFLDDLDRREFVSAERVSA